MKTCKKCNEEKNLKLFVKHKQCVDGYSNTCKVCKLLEQKKYREKCNNSSTKKYEKTKSGFVMRAYRNMQSRIKGIQAKKYHLYFGKSILAKEKFYEWCQYDEQFHILFDNWQRKNYDRKLTPSIDRIDSSKGYIIGNMQWITHSENSRKTSRNKCTL
jgi:hypothetical protein